MSEACQERTTNLQIFKTEQPQATRPRQPLTNPQRQQVRIANHSIFYAKANQSSDLPTR